MQSNGNLKRLWPKQPINSDWGVERGMSGGKEAVSPMKMDYSPLWSTILSVRSHQSTSLSVKIPGGGLMSHHLARVINIVAGWILHCIIYLLRESEIKYVLYSWVDVEIQKNVICCPYCDIIFPSIVKGSSIILPTLFTWKIPCKQIKTLNLITIAPTNMCLYFIVAPRAVHVLYSSHLHHHVPNCSKIVFLVINFLLMWQPHHFILSINALRVIKTLSIYWYFLVWHQVVYLMCFR